VTTWGHDPSEIPVSGAITMLLDALQHSPVLVQAICRKSTKGIGNNGAKTKTVSFPFRQGSEEGS
jgi:hypothetical protein